MRGVLLCLAASGLLGAQVPLAKLAYEAGSDPLTFAVARSLLAIVPFFALAHFRGHSLSVPRIAFGPLFLILLSMAGITYGYLGALERIPAGLAAMIFYLNPILVMLAASAKARTWPGILGFAVVSLAFAGLGMVFAPSIATLDPVGIAMALLAACAATLYFLTVPVLQPRLSSVVTMAWGNVAIVILFTPAILSGASFPGTDIGWVWFGLAAICYAAGLGLAFPAVIAVGPTRAAMLFNFEPVAVLALSVPLLSEILSVQQYLGACLVLVALVLACRPEAPGPQPAVNPREDP